MDELYWTNGYGMPGTRAETYRMSLKQSSHSLHTFTKGKNRDTKAFMNSQVEVLDSESVIVFCFP